MSDKFLKSYEVSFLSKSEKGAAVIVEHLTRFGAEISSEGKIREMKISYPINRNESAYFGCIQCKIPTDAIGGIRDAVKLDKEILRVLIVSPLPERAKGERPRMTPGVSSEAKGRTGAKEVMKSKPEAALSNDLLEEKLEEILN